LLRVGHIDVARKAPRVDSIESAYGKFDPLDDR
jgi:hypothetical protein